MPIQATHCHHTPLLSHPPYIPLAEQRGRLGQGLGGGERDEPDVIRRTGRQHCQAQEIGIDARLPAQAYWPLSLRAELFCCPVRLECHRGRLPANTIGNGGRIGVGERDAVALVFQRSAQVVYGGCRWDALDPQGGRTRNSAVRSLTGSGVGHSERSEGEGARNYVKQSWELFRITAALHQLRSALNGHDGFSAYDEQRSN